MCIWNLGKKKNCGYNPGLHKRKQSNGKTNGGICPFPTYKIHIYIDERGKCPLDMHK
jgi:hypothetical protein